MLTDVLMVTREEVTRAFEHWCKCVKDGCGQPVEIEAGDAVRATEAFFASVAAIRQEKSK